MAVGKRPRFPRRSKPTAEAPATLEVLDSSVDAADALLRAREENETLYRIINTVGSSLELERVLDGVVDLATRATNCHACFIYFVEDEHLRLRAASPMYASLVGRVEMGLDEGLTGWVARNKTPEFIRDNALEDPRMKFVPELEEERFQSMVAVPVLARSSDVIGVIVLHTAAPREFEEDVLNFLVHTASLVAGAIENAQLYQETRRQVEALTTLSSLSQTIAGVTLREDLYGAVTGGVRELLGADVCQIYLLDHASGELELVASDPSDAPAPRPRVEGTDLLLDLLRREAGGRGPQRMGGLARALWPDYEDAALLVAPLVAGDEHLGILCCLASERHSFSEQQADLFRAVANQTSVGIKKTELIERLTSENIVRDMFDALAAGDTGAAQAKATEAGCDLARPHVFLHAEPAPEASDGRDTWPQVAERLEQRLRTLAPSAFFDVRPQNARALLPLSDRDGSADLDGLRETCNELAASENFVAGLSGTQGGPAEGRRSLREAADAARIGRALCPAGGALSYADLGAYKYLVHLDLDDAPDDRHWKAVERLLDYDLKRQTKLVDTLEQFLRDRRSIAESARALYIHPNTLRQRLDRIEKLSGLDLAEEDLLSLELAIKLVRLQHAAARP